MTILYLDTAMNACVVAVGKDGKGQGGAYEIFSKCEPMFRGQAERLMPMCDDVLKQSATKPAELTHIAVTIGPGAFTGLRVAMSAARIMALSLNIPVMGLTTLECIAFQAAHDIQDKNLTSIDKIAVLVETKRSDFYFALYERNGMTPICEPIALEANEITPCIDAPENTYFCGDAVNRYFEGITPPSSQPEGDYNAGYVHSEVAPNPKMVIQLIRDRINANNIEDSRGMKPMYLRQADVSPPKKIRKIEN